MTIWKCEMPIHQSRCWEISNQRTFSDNRRRFYPFSGLKNFTTISCFHLSIQMYFDAWTQVSITTFFYAGCPNSCTRLLRKSATIIFPSGVNARPWGSFSWPSPSPFVPNLLMKRPSLENTWMRWLSLSATIIFPSWPTATPVGRINSPTWLPLRPKLNINRPRESNTWEENSEDKNSKFSFYDLLAYVPEILE